MAEAEAPSREPNSPKKPSSNSPKKKLELKPRLQQPQRRQRRIRIPRRTRIRHLVWVDLQFRESAALVVRRRTAHRIGICRIMVLLQTMSVLLRRDDVAVRMPVVVDGRAIAELRM